MGWALPSEDGEAREGTWRPFSRLVSLFAPFRPEMPGWLRRLPDAEDRAVTYSLWRTEIGAGPSTVVWLHGIGGTHRYWTCVPSSLTGQHWRSILVDLLGFGASPRPWIRYTMNVHLAALHRSIGGERGPLILVGHSLGALLALAYAARYPGRVKALVLISLPNFGGLEGAAKWFAARPGGWIYTNMWAMALACVLTRRVAGWLLPRILTKLPREFAEDMVRHNVASWTTTLWEVLYRQDARALADEVDPTIPVLLLHGVEDRSAPLDAVTSLIRERPIWSLVALEGLDHHPWLEQPAACVDSIRTWLDSPG